MRLALGLASLLLGIVSVEAQGAAPAPAAQPPRAESRLKADTFNGLTWRGIGPAMMSGRIGDIVVDPQNSSIWYVAVASGGVFKTTNAGTTWTPIFDDQGSFSIGCLALDPKDPHIVWVGTGENNSQRSVGYGDGVYKSLDGGKNWENVGLKNSEHIGKILIDPRDSQVVYVAAQGPLWAPGGDRGLFKSTDGGRTWKAVLKISDNTGVSDIAFDPRNPDVLYAAAYQRRRHVFTLVDGGPESAIYKSNDAGATFKKLERGLPTGDIGRIGLAVSPVQGAVVFALIETPDATTTGFYRSEDGGASWERRSGQSSSSPQYYQELIPDPVRVDRVYSMDTFMQVTEDGGKTFRRVGERLKHVDNHALYIDPKDNQHLIAGCDGGLYETFDRGATWRFFFNLPVTQFYRVALDNDQPFYNIYGGTQDNNTEGGPSRTKNAHGICNADWFITTGGDGFWSQIDPTDPNIVYSESQYGGLVRYDRKSGETVDIQPQPAPLETALRWNWDSPLIISPHNPTRLYFAANRLFRSDDRGQSWRPISADLTRQLDRNALKVMGRVQSVDAVAKNASTSFYGNSVSLSESPLKEGLIYVGTDDGLVQTTDDGGARWRRTDTFPAVPEFSYVSDLQASRHEPDTVYAAFDNHKAGDFRPYVLLSRDKGQTWASISGDLPVRGTVYAILEDRLRPDLLFAGTEFGLFFTLDRGQHWVALKSGLPTINVRDIALQDREDDLVLATFGRGFYVMDDISPLRRVTPALLEQEAVLFPLRRAWAYIPAQPYGATDAGSQGDSHYLAPNPPFGVVVTYYLREGLKTQRVLRQEQERILIRDGKDTPYPAWDTLRAEDREPEPEIVVTISDEAGKTVRRLSGSASAGFHRVAWDLRWPSSRPVDLSPVERSPWDAPVTGPLAAPGTYQVSLAKRVQGRLSPLGGPEKVDVVPLAISALPAADRAETLAFQQKVARLQRAALGADEALGEARKRLDHIHQALFDSPGADPQLMDEARRLVARLKDLGEVLHGDSTRSRRNEPVPPTLLERVERVVGSQWVTAGPTATQRRDYQFAADLFEQFLPQLQAVVERDLKQLEDALEAAGAPWTPGRFPRWKKE